MDKSAKELMRLVMRNVRWAGVFCLIGLCQSAFCGVWYVDAVNGDDSNDGISLGTAFKNIQRGIDVSANGDIIRVASGVYSPIECDNKSIVIESIDGPHTTIIDGGGTSPCANIGGDTFFTKGTNTTLKGFTVRNGRFESSTGSGGIVFGTAEGCIISNNYSRYHGGGSYGGVRIDCVISGNTADLGNGGGMANGTANRCIIIGNIARNGGGSSDSNLRNCLLDNNDASNGEGGGAHKSVLDHCTVVRNVAGVSGGVYECIVSNSIVVDNRHSGKVTTSYDSSNDYNFNSGGQISSSWSKLSNSFSVPLPDGLGNLTGDPLFVDPEAGNWRLQLASPCVNAASVDVNEFALDLDGNPRVRDGVSDMGAYEADNPAIVGVLVVQPKGGIVWPKSKVVNVGEPLSFYAIGARPFIGFYTNGVFATTNRCINMVSIMDDIVLSAVFDKTDITWETYVAASNTWAATQNGDSPQTAMSWLQQAIDTAISGDTIYVSSGTYEPISVSGKNLIIVGENSEDVIIDGRGEGRCATFDENNGSVVRNFTLQNGNVWNPDNTWSVDWFGGGCLYGTLDNCIVKENRASRGGGAYGSALRNCTVFGNEAIDFGGGTAKCTLSDSKISGNSAVAGGGCYDCNLFRCVVENNVASSGGGLCYGHTENTRISNNSASCGGGGVSDGFLVNCEISGNHALLGGGGYGSIGESAMYGYTSYEAPAMAGLTLLNCTIVYNTAQESGGAVYAYTAANTFEWEPPSHENDWTFYDESSGQYCLVVSIADSIIYGNQTINEDNYNVDGNMYLAGIDIANSIEDGAPDFVDASNGDFRLLKTSPCIDAADGVFLATRIWFGDSAEAKCTVSWESFAAGSNDLDGNPRTKYVAVDLGAYECQNVALSKIPYSYIWGEWSEEEASAYVVPESVVSWDDFAKVLWKSRDAYVRTGTRTEIPPGEGPIVLSLGAISVSDQMMDSDEPIETEIEHGVEVWRFRAFEDSASSSLVGMVGKISFTVASIPLYFDNVWVEAVYGEPPVWLNSEEKGDWLAVRSRRRIEWFVTLVPQSQWADYCANRSAEADSAQANNESPLVIKDFVPDTATSIHNISVRSLIPGETRLWSKDSISSTNWTYNGFSLQAPGTTAAGVHSASNQLFVMATFSETSLDSDGDGIPDVMEEKVYGTNPNKADSSGDGISDWEKVFHYDLNPRVRDTAGDGISDDEKILSGADPRVPLTSEQQEAASRSIRYTYDDDDRLTGTFFGLGGSSIKTKLTPAGNPADIRNRNATK